MFEQRIGVLDGRVIDNLFWQMNEVPCKRNHVPRITVIAGRDISNPQLSRTVLWNAYNSLDASLIHNLTSGRLDFTIILTTAEPANGSISTPPLGMSIRLMMSFTSRRLLPRHTIATFWVAVSFSRFRPFPCVL
jgi:hypothetical protein